ncbi:MAG TPA: helix-turn-helix transcriptional regulator [Candidatus Binataceae bacterium]|nr:helix-turn-helix transcriptional regulator [Candidatus Binataceae bacterium]
MDPRGEQNANPGFRAGIRDHTPANFASGDTEQLGANLVRARQARNLTLDEAASQIRVPAKYLSMIEASDYGSISDALYLLPYVRSYVGLLQLDSDLMAAKFVQEVQRAEVAAAATAPLPPAKEESGGHSRGWFTTAALLLFVVAALYLATQRF